MLLQVLKYNYKLYIKSHKYILPILILAVYICMTYSIKPMDVTGTFIVSGLIIFIIMSIIGFTYLDGQDSVSEQVLILKIKSHTYYWIYKILFISLISLLLSFFAILIPIILDIVNGFTFFKPVINVLDVVIAFLFHILLGIMGGVLGMLMQPRIIENRKSALLFNVLIIILSLVKYPIIKEFPFAKYVIWAVPPVNDFNYAFMNLEHFNFNSALAPLAFIILYILFECYLLIKLMKRNLY